MQLVEPLLLPLDALRGAFLRRASQRALLARLLGRRETRIALLGSLQVLLLLGLTARWPVGMYFVGPVVLGVAHVAADVRYLALRDRLPRTLLLAFAGFAAVVTLGRLCAPLHVATAAQGARMDMVIGALWVGVALAARFARKPAKLALAAPAVVLSMLLLVRYASVADLWLTHLHNVAAFVLWFALFRRRPGWAFAPVVITALGVAFLVSGLSVAWAHDHGGLVAFGERASHMAAACAPGLAPRLAMGVTTAFIFLQSVHYAVWTGWIAQDTLVGEGTPTFRMTLRSLRKDFGPVALGLVVLAIAALGIGALWNLKASVGAYMTLARAHVWLELAAFAYLFRSAPVKPLVASPAVPTVRASVRRLPKALLVVPALACVAGCGLGECPSVTAVSDNTNGSFTYVREKAPAPGAYTTEGSLASSTAADGGMTGASLSANSDSSFNATLYFVDDADGISEQVEVDIVVYGVENGSTTQLGAGSQACFQSDVPLCYPMTGTVTASNFEYDCEENDCGMTLTGSLDARADWGGGSFSVQLVLSHEDQVTNNSCSVFGNSMDGS